MTVRDRPVQHQGVTGTYRHQHHAMARPGRLSGSLPDLLAGTHAIAHLLALCRPSLILRVRAKRFGPGRSASRVLPAADRRAGD